MFGLPPWLLIFPVLGFLILIHELGHFVTAKWFGIKVLEFGFGFPPRIFGVSYKGTIYSLNWLPLGGFVRMVGEEDPTHPDSFARQSVPKRAAVLVAGSFMNLLLPVVIFTILFMLPHDTLVGSSIVVGGVVPGSPAHESGLRPGDAILKVNNHSVMFPDELIEEIDANLGKPTELTVRRGEVVGGLNASPELISIETVTVVPRIDPPKLKVVEVVTGPTAASINDPANRTLTLNPDGSFSYEHDESKAPRYSLSNREISLAAARRYDPNLKLGDTLRQGAVGVAIGITNVRVEETTEPIWTAIPNSFRTIWDILTLTKNAFVEGFTSKSNPGITGPIGIAQATGEGVSQLGFSWIFQLAALLSISLGILNILPIPALDGGRLMFVVIEWLRRGKRISPQREGLVHLVGFAILIGFIVFISYHDIVRLLNGGNLLG